MQLVGDDFYTLIKVRIIVIKELLVCFRFLKRIDTSTPTGKLMLTMIGAINEFERTNLLERQREGIAIAKREKKYKGRKAVTIPDFEEHYKRYLKREINKSELAKELKISRPTLDKLIAEYKTK